MMKRKIYNEMLLWKQNAQGKSALMIDGARRIGKSYIVEEFAKNEYKSYILVDFNNADDNLIGCPVKCSEKQMLKPPIKLLI